MTVVDGLNIAIATFGVLMLVASMVRRDRRRRRDRAAWLTWSERADIAGVLSGATTRAPHSAVVLDPSGRSPRPARRATADPLGEV